MARVLTWQRNGAAALLLLACAYGVFSAPGLAARWGASLVGFFLTLGWGGLAALALSVARRPLPSIGWAVFGIGAIGLRIASAAIVADRTSPGDSALYLELARNLLAGRGLVVWEPYMQLAVRGFYPPLYAMLLAGWGAIAGFGTPSLLALSTATDLGNAALIALLGARLGERRAGIAAGLLYLIWPPVLLAAPLAHKEGLAIACTLVIAHGWLGARERKGSRLAIGLGTGALALVQPGWATLGLLFGLAMLPAAGWRRIIALGLPGAALAVAVLLPWCWRNWQVFGTFVPLTSASGLSLWIGNNPDATGHWMPYPPQLAGLPELAYSRAAGRLAIEWITSDPLGCARLNAHKLLETLGTAQGGIERLAAMRPPLSNTVAAALYPLVQATHVAMLLGGAVALRTANRSSPLVMLTAAALAQIVIFDLWFEFDDRHRAFLTPLLLLASASAVRRQKVRADRPWASRTIQDRRDR